MDGVSYPLGVIPARAASSRFPNKPLAVILGKPMIQHVWEAAVRSQKLRGLVVATDSEEIHKVVVGFGGNAMMTPTTCPSGTDRAAWVAGITHGSPSSILVNLQGDEPLMQAESIDHLVAELENDLDAEMATLAVRKLAPEELANPNVVKVLLSTQGRALYFSRQPLQIDSEGHFFKHVGIYAFRCEALSRFCEIAPTSLEHVERLEQLRALENGFNIRVAVTDCDTISVDMPEDIARVEAHMKRSALPMSPVGDTLGSHKVTPSHDIGSQKEAKPKETLQ